MPPSEIAMRATVHGLIDAIEPFDEVESRHRADVLSWINSGAEIFRLEKPATPPQHLVSYCVVVDPARHAVLLVDHRDAGLWLPPGGHVDPGEHPADAAQRELREELGISPPFHRAVGRAPLLVTATETVGNSANHVDVSLWFVFESDAGALLRPDDREFVATEWWPMSDVAHGPDARFDPHLPRFVQKLRASSAAT